MAITVAPLTATVLNAVDPKNAGAASGINNAVADVAGLLAIAVLGILAFRVFDRTLDRRLSEAGMAAIAERIPPAERHKLGAAHAPPGLSGPETRRVERAIAGSLSASFQVSMEAAAFLALLGAGTAAVLVGARRAGADSAYRGALPPP